MELSGRTLGDGDAHWVLRRPGQREEDQGVAQGRREGCETAPLVIGRHCISERDGAPVQYDGIVCDTFSTGTLRCG